ncbi:serine/threonine-protein kinase [Mycolicibacterium iranicum]|uniref:non-specific serine/threonine protein kinase n=2 Tax=Mycolicibacterium iranicum TaxID=912594 RepID=A0A839QKV6_MYCIR|nr:serine/threonine-protein kinase [Mycolicibacterium iranicum]
MTMTEREILAGRYELRGVLGCGGMAEVRDGWDMRLDRAVAVKLLHPALLAQPDLRRRFEDEARCAAALTHPNIVSVHDSGEDDGRPFIVMERLPGDTLHDHIAQGPQAPHRVRAMLDDVLAALAAAHGIGLLHRDIKPGNILVAADGVSMKVGDFGIAKSAGTAHTMTGQIIGTIAYMSPERIGGAPASVADDLYAVGVVGYEALTGRRAFPQDNPAALAHAIMSSGPPSLRAERPDIDPAISGAIERAMSRDPRQRFATANQMRAALNGDHTALLAGAGVAPPGPRPATKVLAQPVPAQPDYFAGPASVAYVPPRRRAPMSRPKKILAAAGALTAITVTAVALASDPSSTTTTPEPVATSTAPPPPPPPPSALPPPPPPTSAPVTATYQEGQDSGGPGESKKKGGNGNGKGNGKRD